MNKPIYLNGVYYGKVAQCYGFETAINKSYTEKRLYLSFEGLVGDECADKRHHGGKERALHQYPLEHYSYWQKKYGTTTSKWQAPGMGENLSTEGMIEKNVCIGDRYQWGEAIIEVSQPRSPLLQTQSTLGYKPVFC